MSYGNGSAMRPKMLVRAASPTPEAARESVAAFVLLWSRPAATKPMRCGFFVLFYLNPADGNREPVTTEEIDLKLPEGAERESAAEEIAKRLVDEAQKLAEEQTVGGRRAQFLIAAYRSQNPDEHPPGTHRFALESPGDVELGWSETEGSTTLGQIAHAQRWAENHGRMAVHITERALEKFERLLERSMARQEHLEDRNTRLCEQIEMLADRRVERELNVRRGTLEIERNERLYKMLEVGGAKLIAKYMGFEQDSHPLTAFLEKLDIATLQRIAAQLPPDRQAELAELLRSAGAAKTLSVPKAAAPTNANGTGNGAAS